MSARTTVTLLYRGPLASCNYACAYCPFAKRPSSREELADDRAALDRFVDWIEESDARDYALFFTPWGEALIRRHYPDSIRRLSHFPHVRSVGIQTNLSADVSWLADVDRDVVSLWATYHPTEARLDDFVARVRAVRALGANLSVGIVGKIEHRQAAEDLRGALPDDVYVWVNAYKSEGTGYYDESTLAALRTIDPLVELNEVRHASRGRSCRTGGSVFSVDGRGDVRRCHFVPDVLGNLYDGGLEPLVSRRPCPNDTCGCHIGYVHLEHLDADARFGAPALNRIPERRTLSVLRGGVRS